MSACLRRFHDPVHLYRRACLSMRYGNIMIHLFKTFPLQNWGSWRVDHFLDLGSCDGEFSTSNLRLYCTGPLTRLIFCTNSQIGQCGFTLTIGMCGVVLDVVDSKDFVRVRDVFGLLIFGSSISVSNTYTHTWRNTLSQTNDFLEV